MRGKIIRFICVSCLISILQGLTAPCLLNAEDEPARESVHPNSFEFLTDPSTDKEAVISALGNPDLIWATAQVFVYHYVYSPGFFEDNKWGFLMIQFDGEDKVIRIGWRLRPRDGDYAKLFQQFVMQPLTEALALPTELIEYELRKFP